MARHVKHAVLISCIIALWCTLTEAGNGSSFDSQCEEQRISLLQKTTSISRAGERASKKEVEGEVQVSSTQVQEFNRLLASVRPPSLAMLGSQGPWNMIAIQAGARASLLLSVMTSAAGWLITLATVCVLGVLLYYFGAKWLGRTIQAAIESYDKSFLGVEIEFGDLQVSVGGGFVLIKDCIVHNPEGRGFKSDHVLKVGEVKVDVRMMKLVSSRLKVIEVDVITLKDIDAIVEYKNMFGGESNVHDIQNTIENSDHAKDTTAGKPAEETKTEEKKTEEKKAEDSKDSGTQVIVHKIDIEDIGMKLQTKLMGARVAAGDIHFSDFSKENSAHKVTDVVYLVMKSIFKTLLENVAGKGFTDRFL